MTDLPATDRWESCDPGLRMLAWIRGLPDQLAQASSNWPGFPNPEEEIRGIVACAMGGSAMAAEVALGPVASRMPCKVVRSETPPAWAGPGWLVMACSYSGNTRETLACFERVSHQGCALAAVSAGGILAEKAAERGVLHRELVPGQPPRTAIGQAVVGILWALWIHGVVDDPREHIAAAESALRAEWGQGLGAPEPWLSSCGRIAQSIGGKYLLVAGAGDTAPAALRWSQQLNENAKCPCFALEVPEMLHNHVEGLEAAAREGGVLVLLKDRSQTYAEEASLDYLASLFASFGGMAFPVTSQGDGLLERIFSLMYQGDQVSYLASLLRGMDPTPVERIGHLKKVLAPESS